jgi:hypothetical protein
LDNPEIRKLIRHFLIELVIYAVLVIGYFFLVLQFLNEPLYNLYEGNLVVYAFIALGLIVAQGVLLEFVTSYIMRLLGIDQVE